MMVVFVAPDFVHPPYSTDCLWTVQKNTALMSVWLRGMRALACGHGVMYCHRFYKAQSMFKAFGARFTQQPYRLTSTRSDAERASVCLQEIMRLQTS